ncbi:MAG: hypothetical protein XD50_0766 [Clostridia bacterium 41_269]|nr:MAG: hypothetical protein XD50_0766 [Clostridia bacterium 41_269]
MVIFFNIYGEGAPIGPMVVGGRTAASPSKIDGLYALGITQDRRAVIQSFSLWGKVISPSGMEFPISGLNKKLTGNRMVPTATMISSISMMICGEDLLGGTMDIQFPLRFWLKIVK